MSGNIRVISVWQTSRGIFYSRESAMKNRKKIPYDRYGDTEYETPIERFVMVCDVFSSPSREYTRTFLLSEAKIES